MLTRLRIQDLLLVHQAEIECAPGLNVLTGETGAGKSILLRGLALALGRRADGDWIRRGAPLTRIETTFRPSPRALRRARSLGLAADEGELCIVREVRREGGGRCFVNGTRLPLAALQRLGDELVEIHGQREEERFRRADSQRDLLDLFGGHGELRRDLRAAHRARALALARLNAHRERIVRLARDEEWLRYQVEEIGRIAPEPGEEERLRDRVLALRSIGRRAEWIALAEEWLVGRRGAVVAALEELDHRLAGLGLREDEWAGLRDEMQEVLQRARALARSVREARREADAGHAELPELEARLTALDQLARKHKRALPEVLALHGEMQASLEELARGREIEERLLGEERERAAELARLAATLTAARAKAAAELTEAVHVELDGLRMSGCRLQVVFTPFADDAGEPHGPAGSERVSFEVETNPGEGFRALGRVASGGEMARLALALRVVLGERGHALLAVFDEIDAGLGGLAARAVATRLAQVAAHQQVLLVTHLPLIAAAARRHFAVEKRSHAGAALVGVRALEGDERVAEIARMLAGDGRDAQARQHAAALLESGFSIARRRRI